MTDTVWEFGWLLERLKAGDLAAPAPAAPAAANGATDKTSPAPTGELPPFGELLNELPKEARDTDRILLAGLYAQRQSGDGTFTTGDANTLLVEQGTKLSNASQAMKGNADSKRAFRVGKRNWKIGKPGEEHLASLGMRF